MFKGVRLCTIQVLNDRNTQIVQSILQNKENQGIRFHHHRDHHCQACLIYYLSREQTPLLTHVVVGENTSYCS